MAEVLELRLAPAVNLSIANPAPFPEGDSGTTNMMFVVTRSGDLALAVTVDFTTQDGSAVAGVDYQARSGTLSFAPNQTTATIAVPIIGNTLPQPNRTFTVELANPLFSAAFAVRSGFGVGLNPTSVAVGDFNTDGKPDLAIGNVNGNSVSVRLNTTTPGAGTPTFGPQQAFPIAFGTNPTSVAVGDFNGDGKPDLAVTMYNGSDVVVLVNATAPGATTPSFPTQTAIATGGTNPSSVAVGDLNGDGKPDLAVANQGSANVSVLLNTTTLGDPFSFISFGVVANFPVGTSPISLAMGDLNGDGRPDLAVANYTSGNVSVLLNMTPAGASTPLFAGQQTFTAGTGPFGLVMADLNGDGSPDLATADNSSGTASVRLNTTPPGAPSATFAPRQSFATNANPHSVAAGDLNGDGRTDLAVANFGSAAIPGVTVSVLLNTIAPGAATPSFAPQVTFPTGNNPSAVALGDINGDGKLDLAVTDRGFNTVSVLLNQAGPAIVPPLFAAQMPFATGSNPRSVAVGDFNVDGKPDLAVTNRSSNTVSVLLNTTAAGAASPSFAAQVTFAAGIGPISVAMGDFNGDGKPDLAVANRFSNTVSVLLNTTAPGGATPTFAMQQSFATGTEPQSVAVGDFNGDGRPDLAVANRLSNTVSVLLNTTTGPPPVLGFAPQQPFATGSEPFSVAVGDFNGDGKLDLAVANKGPDAQPGNTVSVLLNTTLTGGGLGFAPQQPFGTVSVPFSVVVGDINGDGKPDLAVSGVSGNTVSVLLNTTAPGAPTPSFAAHATFATGTFSTSVAVGDFNGDGKPDLAVANGSYTGTVSVLLNTTAPGAATPSFAAQQPFATGLSPTSVAVADLNGDGKPDLAVANYNGLSNTVSVLLNTTAPGAILSPQQPFDTGSRPRSVAVADFNGDGKPDLAVANGGTFATPGNTVSVLLNMTPPGAATPSFATQQTFTTGSNPRAVAVGDFNGDGKPDLAVVNFISNTVSVLLNQTAPGAAAPSFAPQRTFATSAYSYGVAVGDLNGDGRPDLAVTSRYAGVSVLLNTTAPGAATPLFAAQVTFTTSTYSTAVAVGDLNGDGRPDLAVTLGQPTPGIVAVLRNQTAPGADFPSFAAAQFVGTGSSPSSVAAGDLNGDGRPDLATANLSANSVSVLLNQTLPGATVFNFATHQPFATGSFPFSVAMGDLNGDGRPDLAAANTGLTATPGTTLSVLLHTAAPGATVPSFAAQQPFATGSRPSSVAVRDFNGDGKPDLAVANYNSDSVSVLLNTAAAIAIQGSPATGTILDDEAVLLVTAFTPTSTGFTAQFNRPFVAADLNLYDTQTGGLGAADATLTRTAGAIRGSLVVNPTSTAVTFIATGGVLPADTYTVVLRSTGNGFHTSTGLLLDGNSDGTPGDNYTNTFTVAPSSAVVVSVPDFTRGPGQSVTVPATNTTPGIPLRLSNGAGVDYFDLTLRYDPALLTITGATLGPGAPAGAGVVVNTSTPGTFLLAFFSPTPLAAGPADVVLLTATVPNTAPYTSKHVLDLTNVRINEGAISSRDDDGLHIVGYFGDVSGNGTYSSVDANRVQRVASGLDSGFSAYQLADPVIVSDINGNGQVNSIDANRILQEAVGMDRPEIPPLPLPPVSLVSGGPDPLLHFSKKLRGLPGQKITVPLLLDPADGLEAVDVAMSFDVARLELLTVARGKLTGDFDLFAVNPDRSNGTVRVSLGRSAVPIVGKGKGSVLLFTFRIKDNAPRGRAVLNLRQSVGSTLTQLNEGGLDLIPDPSNEAGDALDGAITVVAPRKAGKSLQTVPAIDMVFAELARQSGRRRFI